MEHKRKMQRIIDENLDAAEMGCPIAQGQVIQAQAELDRIADHDRLEWWAMLNRQAKEREELTNFSMLTDEEMAGNW